MITAGLDIGSVATKAVIWDHGQQETRAAVIQPTGWEPEQAGQEALQAALGESGLSPDEVERLVVTGYGRKLWSGQGEAITEVTCLARGIRQVVDSAGTVFDIGGQDSKVLSLDEQGAINSFALNDRCAAGTGRFLEMAAQRLGLSVGELGELALTAQQSLRLSSTCAVFVESEIVGLLARGADRAQLSRGLCEAIANQMLALAGKMPRKGPVVLVGGVAQNRGVQAALEQARGEKVLVPAQPQVVVALGAALLAAESTNN